MTYRMFADMFTRDVPQVTADRMLKYDEANLKWMAKVGKAYKVCEKTSTNATYLASYAMTPPRHELPPAPLVDPDNYVSGDDEDDEDLWAEGLVVNDATANPDVVFDVDDMPDFDKIFEVQKRKEVSKRRYI